MCDRVQIRFGLCQSDRRCESGDDAAGNSLPDPPVGNRFATSQVRRARLHGRETGSAGAARRRPYPSHRSAKCPPRQRQGRRRICAATIHELWSTYSATHHAAQPEQCRTGLRMRPGRRSPSRCHEGTEERRPMRASRWRDKVNGNVANTRAPATSNRRRPNRSDSAPAGSFRNTPVSVEAPMTKPMRDGPAPSSRAKSGRSGARQIE